MITKNENNKVDNNNSHVLNVIDIKNYLPHRYPFLLIDKVIYYELKKLLIGIKSVTVNESFFNGHFPLKPVMPGVLIIESLAQACGVLYFLSFGKRHDDFAWFFLVGIDDARFKKPVLPGDQLKLVVELIRNKFNVFYFKVRAFVDERVVCSAKLKIARGEVKNDS